MCDTFFFFLKHGTDKSFTHCISKTHQCNKSVSHFLLSVALSRKQNDFIATHIILFVLEWIITVESFLSIRLVYVLEILY